LLFFLLITGAFSPAPICPAQAGSVSRVMPTAAAISTTTEAKGRWNMQ
jgi:hypothetical protein